MNKTIALAIIGVVLLAGCSPEPNTPMHEQVPTTTTDSRITVTRIGVLADNLAYNERRGIYLIKDAKTGQEYVGVSGVGISEIGSHVCGKNCTEQDER